MAFPVTADQLRVLQGSHEMSTQVVVLRGGQNLGEIPIMGGSLYATYGTQGSRDGYITVDRNVIDRGLLNPLSDNVVIYTGVKNQFQVPIFTGRCDVQNADSDGFVQVQLLSRSAEAIRAAFETPWATTPGQQGFTEIKKILQNVDPSWSVDTSAALNSLLPAGLVWEEDRGQALDQLAQGGSNIWQPDRTGGFIVYRNPYSVGPTLASQSKVVLRDGVGGTLVNVKDALTREGIWNSVTVVVERVDNTAPIRVTARDMTVGSPTFWGGLFGKQNIVVKNQTPQNIAEAQNLASRILRQSLALQRSWQITTPHLPILDPGDVFTLFYRNVVWVLVVETVSYSVSAQDPTQISARELMLHDVDMFV